MGDARGGATCTGGSELSAAASEPGRASARPRPGRKFWRLRSRPVTTVRVTVRKPGFESRQRYGRPWDCRSGRLVSRGRRATSIPGGLSDVHQRARIDAGALARCSNNLARCRECTDVPQEELSFRVVIHRTEVSG